MSNLTKERRSLPKVGESFMVFVNRPVVVRCTHHNRNGTVGYEFFPDSSNWAQLNEHNLWKSDQSPPPQPSGASGGTSAQLPKRSDSVRVERIYMSSEQQAEEAEFGEVTDNIDEDGLTAGIVVMADHVRNRYLVDVDDECDIVCSLQRIANKLVLVERS